MMRQKTLTPYHNGLKGIEFILDLMNEEDK